MPVVGIWAVPVFPATVYPGTAALVPVPSFTTCSNMEVSSESTGGEKTWWVAEGAVFVTTPEVLTVACTSFGATKVPPLATALYASRTCRALTASTWPMGRET